MFIFEASNTWRQVLKKYFPGFIVRTFHIHIHTHRHAHRHLHAYIHTYIYTYIHTYTHLHAYIYFWKSKLCAGDEHMQTCKEADICPNFEFSRSAGAPGSLLALDKIYIRLTHAHLRTHTHGHIHPHPPTPR